MATDDQATSTATAPGDGDGTANGAEGNSAAAQSSNAQEDWQPDERYKGLQRELQKEKDRAKQLEARLQEAGNSAASGNGMNEQMTMALLRELAATGEEGAARARVLAVQLNQQRLEGENQRLKQERDQAQHDARVREIQESNLAQLRAIARDLGADPDSELIDYGSEDEALFARIEKVRESAKKAMAPAKKNEGEAKVENQEGGKTANQSHNTQGGVAAPPASTNKVPTEADLARLTNQYARNPTAENAKAMRDAQAALAKSQGWTSFE